MIQRESNITIADNSGAKVGKIIGASGYLRSNLLVLEVLLKLQYRKLYLIVELRSMMS
jgi:hypothetical protein